MATAFSLGPAPRRRAQLTRRIRLLVAATITYNIIEAVVAITAGTMASSSALIGFGLDSVIEVSSAAQRLAGPELGSASAVADSKRTLLCTHLSAVLLVGLVLNATLGRSWADPIAALVIAPPSQSRKATTPGEETPAARHRQQAAPRPAHTAPTAATAAPAADQRTIDL